MSETITRTRMGAPTDDPFAVRFAEDQIVGTAMVPAGSHTDRASAQIVTAQRCAVKRNRAALLQEAIALAASNGGEYYYRFPVKNRKAGTTDWIEGPSIGCAMGAVSCYGNCSIEAFPASDTPTHWVFVARFVDFEKGVTVMRSFQQRKNQATMGNDAGRGEDLLFQIGQSKAMRNAICAALPWLTNEMFKAAKRGTLERIEQNPEACRKWLVGQFAEMDVPITAVERVVGRKTAAWLVPDMAKLLVNVQSIKDGFSSAEDLFPTDAQIAQRQRDEQEDSRRAEGGHEQHEQMRPTQQTSATTAASAPHVEESQSPPQEGRKPRGERAPRRQAASEAEARVPDQAPPPPPPEPEPEPETAREPEPEPGDDEGGLVFQ